MKAFGRSEKGPVRSNNQDAFLLETRIYSSPTEAFFCSPEITAPLLTTAVADGMGGHSFGEKASRLALEYLSRAFFPLVAPLSRDYLLTTLESIHNKVLTEAEILRSNMGTTLTGSCFEPPVNGAPHGILWIFHVGDSQLWRYRSQTLQQLTTDHNLAQEEHKPYLRHTLTGCIGGGLERLSRYQLIQEVWQQGDIYIFNTDGLMDGLSTKDLESLITKYQTSHPQEICEKIISQALLCGSQDNITALVVQC